MKVMNSKYDVNIKEMCLLFIADMYNPG